MVSSRWIVPVLVLAACSARTQVRTSHDPDADFKRLRTYTWEAGEESGDPALDDRRLAARIRGFADRELAAKGFKPAATEPDFVVTHHTVLQRKRREASGDEEYAGIWRDNYTPNVGDGSDDGGTSKYYVGNLLLEIHEGGSRRLLWFAQADTELNLRAPQEARDIKLRNAVRKMLASFPP